MGKQIRKSIMKFFTLFILLFIFYQNICLAQLYENYIEGNVSDAVSGEAIPNANVYLSNTGWGSTTNSKGYFKIKNVYPAIYQLVVSMFGYKTQTQELDFTKKSTRFINIKLIPQEIKLDEIAVMEKRPDEWQSDLKKFKELFLGKSHFAKECEIENELYINFRRDNNCLMAECNQPLIIKNNALGFRIKCNLINFSYNQKLSHLRYNIYPLFEELETQNNETKKTWEENRKLAYKSSLEYFLTVFANNTFMQEQFKVYKNSDLYTHNKLFRDPVLSSEDYFQQEHGSKIRYLQFDNYLEIKYTGAGIVEEYENKKIISWIKLVSYFALIDEDGMPLDNSSLLTYGYWSQLGVADLMPRYYFSNKSILK